MRTYNVMYLFSFRRTNVNVEVGIHYFKFQTNIIIKLKSRNIIYVYM